MGAAAGDRDTLPSEPQHRAGVPQSHHAHALLPRGQAIIGELFPGLMDALRANGATAAHDVVPAVFITPAGKLPTRRDPNETLAFSRFFLEWAVRERLLALPGISARDGCEVLGLVTTPDQKRVTGVRARERGSDAEETLLADLVVDASGRGSQAPAWLSELSYGAVPEETINSNIGYASRFFR